MPKTKSSKQWLKEHFEDEYVKRSQEAGYRSRASFKLLEIQEKDHLIKTGMTVIDLGAAPGGWAQVASKLVGAKGRVIASDILPIDPIPGVEFIQGDFTDEAVLQLLLQAMQGGLADLVLSDMAPNMSGVKDIDQPRVMHLADLALDLARSVLSPGAYFIVKVFHGEGLTDFQSQLRESFEFVKVRKPAASRARSSEIYLLAGGFRPRV